MILKNLSFLKVRYFDYDLVLLNRRQQNHKNKNVEQKLLVFPRQMLPPKCSLHPLRAKIVIPSKKQFLRNFPPAERGRGHCARL